LAISQTIEIFTGEKDFRDNIRRTPRAIEMLGNQEKRR